MTDDAPVADEIEVEAEAEAVEIESEEQVNQEETPSESSPEKESNGVQKRIGELTRKQREAERERDYWRKQAMDKAPEPEPEPPPVEVKTLEDFDYDEEKFQSYIFQQAKAEAKEAARQAYEEETQRTTQQQRIRSFQGKEKEFAKGVEDYYDYAHSDIPVTQEMADLIAESDSGPSILYHLGKNPDIAENIAYLPPVQMAREIGRLEVKLSEKPEKSVSKAPPPPPKVEGIDNAIPKTIKDNMTQDQWNEHRRKVIAQRRR
jgi:hypothetical protein